MRIAIYHNLSSGGGKRALYEMARRLAARHELDRYTLSCADHDFCDLRPHCHSNVVFPFRTLPLFRSPLGRLNQLIRSWDLLRLRAIQRRIATQIDSAGYDLVFVHNCQYGQSPSLLSFLRTPSVYYCQEPPRLIYEPPIPRPYGSISRGKRLMNALDPLPGLYRRLYTRIDRKNVLAAALVLANSAYSRESLYRAYGIFSRVCYLGVDATHFRPLSLPKENYVLSVGELRPHKGFDFLIHSLALIDAPARPPLVLVTNAAHESERQYLEELAAKSGVSVSFRVRVPDGELVRLYNQARLTLYTPIMEPFGFVPIESMACGTPVVGVCEAGVRESVRHDETGILTDRDPGQFAGAVVELLGNPGLCEQLSQRGRVYVERQWSWEHTMADLERHLANVALQKSVADR